MIIGVTYTSSGTPGIAVGLTHEDLDGLRSGELVNVMTQAGVAVCLLSASNTDEVVARMQEGASHWIDTRPKEEQDGVG